MSFAAALRPVSPMNASRDLPTLRVVAPPADEAEGDSEPRTADGRLVLTPELEAEIEQASARLELAEPQDILRWTVHRFAPRFTMATAFGPEGMVLIHMLAEIAADTPIFNLDTGYQFAETLELREEVKRRYGIAVEMKQPATSVEEYERANGGPIYRTNPD